MTLPNFHPHHRSAQIVARMIARAKEGKRAPLWAEAMGAAIDDPERINNERNQRPGK